LEAEGRDPSEVEVLLPARQGSRQAQAIADLAAYDEARRRYEKLVAGGRKDLEADLATLYIEKAFVHENAGDVPGEVALYDKATALGGGLVNGEGRRELADDLAWVYMAKANVLRALGDNRAAAALYDKAIALRECLVNGEGRRELANGLAMTYVNKAAAVS